MQKLESFKLSADEMRTVMLELQAASDRLSASDYDAEVSAGDLLARVAEVFIPALAGDSVTITRQPYVKRQASGLLNSSGCED